MSFDLEERRGDKSIQGAQRRVWQLGMQLFKLIKILRTKTAKEFSKVEQVSTPELVMNISIQPC